MFTLGGNMFFVLVLAVLIVAIIGGIMAGILKTQGQHRLVELAQRERIAAIERGIDPSKLPPLPLPAGTDELAAMYMSPRRAALHQAQSLLVGGLITFAVDLGFALTMLVLDRTGRAWAVGLIPGFVGIGRPEPRMPRAPAS
jgi:predicted PurR-regulated permease PerM